MYFVKLHLSILKPEQRNPQNKRNEQIKVTDYDALQSKLFFSGFHRVSGSVLCLFLPKYGVQMPNHIREKSCNQKLNPSERYIRFRLMEIKFYNYVSEYICYNTHFVYFSVLISGLIFS